LPLSISLFSSYIKL